MLRIFISYSAKDRAFVDELAADLDLLIYDASVWVDQSDGRRGDADWWQGVCRAAAQADVIITALSPHIATCEACRRETAYAQALGKPIIPVLIGTVDAPSLPPEFHAAPVIDYRQRSREQQRTLRNLIAALPAPNPIPDPPPPVPEPPQAAAPASPPPAPEAAPKIPFNPPKIAFNPPVIPFNPPALNFGAKPAVAEPKAASKAARYARPIAKTGPRKAPDLLPGFEWASVPAGSVRLFLEQEYAADQFTPLDDGTAFDVTAFSIGKFPVTNAQFAKFIAAGGYTERRWWTDAGWEARERGWAWDSEATPKRWAPLSATWDGPRYTSLSDLAGPDLPVVGVSWHEANAFCRWMSEATGDRVLLPTEAQWQRAAQGNDGRAYPWGADWDAARCNNDIGGRLVGKLTPVSKYQAINEGAAPFGVVDMAGNVWEWCLTSAATGSISPEDDDRKVIRGGSWYDSVPSAFRCEVRHWEQAAYANANIGFRVVRGFHGTAMVRHLTDDGLIDPYIDATSLADVVQHEPADGVYTIANTFHTFKTLKLDAHLDRLEDSAARAKVRLNLDRLALREALRAMITEAAFGDVRFRISASNALPGVLMLAIEPFKPLKPSVYAQGVKVVTAPGAARHDPASKTIDWQRERQAIEEALPPDAFTALLLGEQGAILEGISSNFYAVLNGELRTAGAGVLGGIAQQIVLEVAPALLPVRREPITLADVPQITDAFITSASRGIVPVIAIDGAPIGSGKPGAITQSLRARYLAWAAEHLEPL